MKAILIGVVLWGLLFGASFAAAQTIRASDVEWLCVSWYNIDGWVFFCDEDALFSVTMPTSKDPKWTMIFKDGQDVSVITTTMPVEIRYRPK